MSVIEKVCDKVAIIVQSKIVEFGPVKEIFKYPKSNIGKKLIFGNTEEHEEEEYPLHSNGYGMYWSGFFSCLKEITSLIDSIEKEPASEDLQEDKDLPVRHHNYLGISQVIHGKYKK